MVRSDMLPQPDRGLGLDRPQTEAFHRRVQGEIVDLHNAGKPRREAMDECDLDKSTVERRVKSINETGSPRAADNRTPE